MNTHLTINLILVYQTKQNLQYATRIVNLVFKNYYLIIVNVFDK